MANNYPTPYTQQAQGMLQGAQAQGFFNPMGSPQINAAVRANALRNADNARRRSALLSRLMGLDPNQARVAAVNQDAQSSGETQGALNNASLGQLLGNQQYFRGLFGGQLGQENQLGQLRYQHNLNQPTFGGIAGGILGQGLGSLFGGFGSRIGAGRQPQMQMQSAPAYDPYSQQQYDPYQGYGLG